MIRISERQLEAFEEAQKRAFPARFRTWWREQIATDVRSQVTQKLVDTHCEEFRLVGVSREPDQFLYLYARALMPKMNDEQYLSTMDAIFARASISVRMKRLRSIAKELAS